MLNVYYISGLGADETVFQFLHLPGVETHFLHWLEPLSNESLEHYAIRMKEKYIGEDAIVIGMSFGGMLATEIAKKFPGMLSILISSVKTKKEFPSIFYLGKYIPLQNWVPAGLQRWAMHRLAFLFGVKTKETKKIYHTIISHSDVKFNAWAIDAMLGWENATAPANCISIHGTADMILPFKKVQADYVIYKGAHLMIINQAAEISSLITKIIAEKCKVA